MLVVVCFVFFVFCVVFERPFSYQHGRKLISAKKMANICAIITKKYNFKAYFCAPQSNDKIAKSNPKQKSIPKSSDL
jgi:hypothetical protein